MTNNIILSADQISKQTIVDNTEAILQQTQQITDDPVRRYFICRAAEQSFSDAKTSLTQAVIDQLAHDNPDAVREGKMIDYEGNRILIQQVQVYDYTGKRDWQAAHREVERQQKALEVCKIRQKAVEAELVASDKVRPIETKNVVRTIIK